MSFLLCHDCYTWVEPKDNRCPECLLVMDLSASDPTPDFLLEVMGELVECLGAVRIPRRLLPDLGVFYATTNGLFFVPQLLNEGKSAENQANNSGSLTARILSLMGDWFPFPRGSVTSRDVDSSERMPEIETADLPALLMAHPGAFFLPRDQIRSLTRKRSRWGIERKQGSRLTISPTGSKKAFHEKMQQLVQSQAWEIRQH